MIRLGNLRYVRLGARDLAQATEYAQRILGLELVRREGEAVYLRGDDRDHTLVYFEGDPADHATGWEVADAAALEGAGAELESHRLEVERGTRTECEKRYVGDFIAFRDLSGNRHELVVRPHGNQEPFVPSRASGVWSFSHIGLRTTDAARDEKFWTTVLSARVSDRIGAAPLLRIDEAHHRIALFPSQHPGVQHINHQVHGVDDVMRSYYFLRERGVRMIQPQEEAGYQPRQFPFAPESFCMWGSKPDIPEFRSS